MISVTKSEQNEVITGFLIPAFPIPMMYNRIISFKKILKEIRQKQKMKKKNVQMTLLRPILKFFLTFTRK